MAAPPWPAACGQSLDTLLLEIRHLSGHQKLGSARLEDTVTLFLASYSQCALLLLSPGLGV